ncbi:MAG: hypothetical protein AABZ61_08665, partial [Bacteroidota bacterium]
MNSSVLLHQMDLFLWDYGNFRNQSMYLHNRFEDPEGKYRKLKELVGSTITTYFDLPQSYRDAKVAPDAMVLYAKEGDYFRYIDEDWAQQAGWSNLYSIAFRLQSSDIPFMFAYDEFPRVLENDGRDVPMLIIDGEQELSAGFANASKKWFGPGKIVFCGGRIGPLHKSLLQELADMLGQTFTTQPAEVAAHRSSDYTHAAPSIPTADWPVLLSWKRKPIVFVKGDPTGGQLLYSSVPISRLAREDLQKVCIAALERANTPCYQISGLLEREVVRYKGARATFIAIKNHSAESGALTIRTASEPIAVFPRPDESQITGENDAYRLELSF